MEESLNVFDEPLGDCSLNPLTGFYRNGCCDTSDQDAGSHTVCCLSLIHISEPTRPY